MPGPVSMFNALPSFAGRPATPPGAMPPGMGQMGSTAGMPDVPGAAPEAREPDIIERLVLLMMKNPQFYIPWMAGLGFQRLLEKSGKFVEKPHRSNTELAGQGYPSGQPGQTGLPSPDQMVKGLRPPGLPGAAGGMPGF